MTLGGRTKSTSEASRQVGVVEVVLSEMAELELCLAREVEVDWPSCWMATPGWNHRYGI